MGTNYDQKEQMFRNYPRVIGPHDDPIISYTVISDESMNVTFKWIDPNNNVQVVQAAYISDGSTVITHTNYHESMLYVFTNHS